MFDSEISRRRPTYLVCMSSNVDGVCVRRRKSVAAIVLINDGLKSSSQRNIILVTTQFASVVSKHIDANKIVSRCY